MPAIEPRRIARAPWPTTLAPLSPITVKGIAWQDDALCAEVGGDVWFPEEHESPRQAKEVCRRCPVRVECLEYALDNDLRFGVWGGTSERERQKIRKQRATGQQEAA